MSANRLKLWTILMPLIALLVSSGIVGWEYARRDHLTSQLASVEKEYSRLDEMRPRSEQAGVRESEAQHHDHHTD